MAKPKTDRFAPAIQQENAGWAERSEADQNTVILANLLAQVTPNNLHHEVDFGLPVDAEIP